MHAVLWILLGGCSLLSSPDEDKDGFSVADGDCDDLDPAVAPGVPERCDGIDNDCNSIVDDNPTDGDLYFIDDDGDGYGTDERTIAACARPDGYADRDCDDGDEQVNPGADNCEGNTGDTGDTVTAGDCPWVGTWVLEQALCSTLPYPDWSDAYEGATLSIAHHPESGCQVTAILPSTACGWTEDLTFSLPQGDLVEVSSEGVVECAPQDCSFEISGEVCEPGDFAADPELLNIAESGGRLTAEALLAHSATSCPLTFTTTWTLQ